jgi:hypothetical protein
MLQTQTVPSKILPQKRREPWKKALNISPAPVEIYLEVKANKAGSPTKSSDAPATVMEVVVQASTVTMAVQMAALQV